MFLIRTVILIGKFKEKRIILHLDVKNKKKFILRFCNYKDFDFYHDICLICFICTNLSTNS